MGLVYSTPAAPAAGPARRTTAKAAAAPGRRKPAEGATASPAPKKRTARSPLTLLNLALPQHALLVLPAEYIDCRQPATTVTPEMVGDPTIRTFKLAFSGEAFGRDAAKQVLWRTPALDLPEIGALAKTNLYKTRATCLTLHDDTGSQLTCWVFGLPTAWLDLRAGDPVWVTGTVERYGSKLSLQLQHRLPEHAIASVWARYKGRAGVITGERVETCVRAALAMSDAIDQCISHVCSETGRSEDELMRECLADLGFASLAHMLQALHAPSSREQGDAASAAARILSALAIRQGALRRHSRPASPLASIAVGDGVLEQLAHHLATQGRTLTAEQRQVAGRIIERLRQQQPLSALLSGDVGTGKTLAFLLPAVAAHLAGAQVAIVAPLRLLADQIARELVERFGPLLRGVQRVENQIDDADAILVGTTGLLNAAQRQSYLPNLLIFDEQHRLSTQQRESCVASRTHTLEVSATPIPRTLAATIYAQVEQLQLTQCPVDKEIRSELVGIADKQRVIGAIRAALARGERCAVIYPRVSPAEGGPAHECVTGAFDSFRAAFPQHAVMIHGDLPQAEIDCSLELFRKGERRLAIASTILEVGIDVPSISVMVVRDADSFGMSQLHQLRGRLARTGGRGEFLMVVDEPDTLATEARRRLEIVRDSMDGYTIAEQDLLLRGFGDLDGLAQSGASDTLFKLVKLSAPDFLGGEISTRRKARAAARADAASRATVLGSRAAAEPGQRRPLNTPAPAAAVASAPPQRRAWKLPEFARRGRAPAPSVQEGRPEPDAPAQGKLF